MFRALIGSLISCLAVSATRAEERIMVPVDMIVDQMTAARMLNRVSFRSYRITREYTLFGKDPQTPKSRVVAGITFMPPHAKTFTIVSHTSGLGERIVREMLEGEVSAVEAYGATDLSATNYDFQLIRTEEWNGQRCYVLTMKPRRKDKGLLRGSIWVDASTFMLHRLVGEPVQGVSWWLRDPHIEFSYGPVEGMWLQTGSISSANVRMFGTHIMKSRDIDYHVGNITGSLINPVQ